MKTSEMIKSKFWRAVDVQGFPPFVLTIAAVTEEIVGRGARPDTKYFLWFMEHNKGLQMNKTRVKLLEYAYGPDSDLWVGRKVRLSYDPTVEMAGRIVGGVKLETPPGAVYQAGAQQAAWGGPPAGQPGPQPAHQPGAPLGAPPKPEPVWNAQTGAWEFPQPPIAAPGASNAVAQNPNAGGGWPGTGQPHPPANQQARDPNMWGGAPTISQRVAAGTQGAPNEWVDSSTGEVRQGSPEFDDDIPFDQAAHDNRPKTW